MGRTGGRVWWISGLVVVWVLAGVVWAAVAFTGADDTEVPVDEVTSQVPIQESDDRFVNVSELCDVVDFSGIEEVTGMVLEDYRDDVALLFNPSEEFTSCRASNFDASLRSDVTVAAYPTAALAVEEYEVHARMNTNDTEAERSDVSSIWTRSYLTIKDSRSVQHGSMVFYRLVAQVDNLLYMHLVGIAPGDDSLDSVIADTMVAIAEHNQALAEADR